MSEFFNLYCDESCHFENDGHRKYLQWHARHT
jgi:hypothetical protein